jgi:Domain of unknown function (DUF1707)
MPEPHLRASDSDRSAVATALGEHMAAGRLTLAEYEERLTRVYETKTLGGLAALTADLPQSAAARTPTPAPARPAAPVWAHACGPAMWGTSGAESWRAWSRTALIVLAIWTATSLAAWDLIYFWPMWVIGPWGAVLLAQTLGGSGSRGGRRDLHRSRIDA